MQIYSQSEKFAPVAARMEVLRCERFAARGAGSLTPSAWAAQLVKRYGICCHIGSASFDGAELRTWALGEVRVVDVRVGRGTVTSASRASCAESEDELMVKLLIEGSATFEQAGQVSHLNAGDVIVIDSSQDFTESVNSDVHMAIFRLPKRLLRGRGISSSIYGTIEPDMGQAEMLVVRDLLTSIVSRSADAQPAFAARIQQQLLDYMDVVLMGPHAAFGEGGCQATLHRARAFVRRNFGDSELDAERIGEALQISASYLNRLFRAEGTSLMRHLWSVRLEQAAQQLQWQPDRRVDQVAYSCGFSSAAHFSRSFRARFGHPPSQRRRADA